MTAGAGDRKGRGGRSFTPKSAALPSAALPSAAPRSVSDLLGTALGSFALKKKAKEYAAFPYWSEIVGDEIAKVAVPEKIVRGRVLHVRVIDAAWAQELSLMKNEILDGLHRLGKGALVEDIRFTIGDPKSFKA